MKKNNVLFDYILLFLGSISFLYFIGLYTKIYFSYFILLYPIFSLLTITYALLEIKQKESLLSRLSPWIRKTMILVVSLCIGLFVLVEGILIYQSYQSNPNRSDYVIVLGAKVNGTTPSRSLRYRLEATVDYYNLHPTCSIVVSGGQGAGEEVSEASIMKKYLLDNGVPETQIIVEDKSTSTYENLTFSKEKIEAQTKKAYTVTIITNGFHTYRALYIASAMGLNASTYSAKEDGYSTTHYYIREFFGLIKEMIAT